MQNLPDLPQVIESLLSGSVDIGNSSRALEDSEKQNGAVENIVAIDGIAVVVNPDTKSRESDKRTAGTDLHR